MANGANPWLGAALAFQGGLGGQGPAQGLAAYNQLKQPRGGQDDLRRLQTMMKLAEVDREERARARRAAALRKAMEGRSPQEQALMQAAPDEALGQLAKTTFGAPAQQKPFTDIAKLNADLEAGRMSQEQYNRAVQHAYRSGDDATALERNARFISEVTGRPLKESAEMMVASASNRITPDAAWWDIYGKTLGQLGATHEQAAETANKAVGVMFPDWSAPGAKPEPEPQPGTAQAGGFSWTDPRTWFGGEEQAQTAATETPGPARPQQQQAETVDLPPGQSLSREQLQKGKRYRFPDGTVARWTGEEFVVE